MRQRKRREKNEGLGLYTYWERRQPNGCLYCGCAADTREHIPPRVFLHEPYPDNLPTVPACRNCNNSFSIDEEYVACYVEVLKSIVNNNPLKNKVKGILEEKPQLQKLIYSQITATANQTILSFERERFERILNKIAMCLAGYEFDEVSFSDSQDIWFDFVTNISDSFRSIFIAPSYSSVLPEISSRFSSDYCTFFIPDHGAGALVRMAWIEVQEKQFQYQVSIEDPDISVKMIISDFLYARIIL